MCCYALALRNRSMCLNPVGAWYFTSHRYFPKNAQKSIPIAHILSRVFRHPQPTRGTPMVTDNSTSKDLLTQLIKPKKSKTWDMRYHWLEDRIKMNQLQLIWKPGKCNRADYFTKRHPPAYHKLMRP